MCIAILNKKHSIITDAALTNCFMNNPDGAGFAFINNNKQLTVIKGIFNLDTFLNTYKYIKEQAISDILIHCRIGTAGLKDANNTHPHYINDDIVLIHNGILHNIDVPKNSKVSDTILFIQKYLKNMTIEQLKDAGYRQLIADAIGTNNKFILMDKYGATYIINAEQGITDTDGNFYSNDSYQDHYYTAYDNYLNYTSFKLSKKLKNKITNNINNLDVRQLAELAEHPLIHIKTGELFSEQAYEDYDFIDYDNIMYLEDISESLYKLYLNLYDSYFNYDYYTAVY